MRHRIRQISVDDSNSMSDLAKIIKELESSSPCPMDGEVHSSDSDLASTLPETVLRKHGGGLESLNIPCDDMDLSQSNHF